MRPFTTPIRCVATALLMFAATATAQAQIDLLKRGQDLLGTGGGSAPAAGGKSSSSLSAADMGGGLKEALRVGTKTVVAQLGKADGFNRDSAIHIPLPESMRTVQQTLGKMGMAGMLDDLEIRLNRAAEAATPKAKELFVTAIQSMSIDDAKKIYDGPNDAATQYFKKAMTPGLRDAFRPTVDKALSDAGAVKAYDNAMGQYKSVPMVPDVKADLTNHALDGALSGIFHYVAQEEAAIRTNPAKRTTDVQKKVFGN